jgi:hypothetical protein
MRRARIVLACESNRFGPASKLTAIANQVARRLRRPGLSLRQISAELARRGHLTRGDKPYQQHAARLAPVRHCFVIACQKQAGATDGGSVRKTQAGS